MRSAEKRRFRIFQISFFVFIGSLFLIGFLSDETFEEFTLLSILLVLICIVSFFGIFFGIIHGFYSVLRDFFVSSVNDVAHDIHLVPKDEDLIHSHNLRFSFLSIFSVLLGFFKKQNHSVEDNIHIHRDIAGNNDISACYENESEHRELQRQEKRGVTYY